MRVRRIIILLYKLSVFLMLLIGILPVDQEAAEADRSLEQLSMTSNDQDGTSESSQSDRPPLPPRMN